MAIHLGQLVRRSAAAEDGADGAGWQMSHRLWGILVEPVQLSATSSLSGPAPLEGEGTKSLGLSRDGRTGRDDHGMSPGRHVGLAVQFMQALARSLLRRCTNSAPARQLHQLSRALWTIECSPVAGPRHVGNVVSFGCPASMDCRSRSHQPGRPANSPCTTAILPLPELFESVPIWHNAPALEAPRTVDCRRSSVHPDFRSQTPGLLWERSVGVRRGPRCRVSPLRRPGPRRGPWWRPPRPGPWPWPAPGGGRPGGRLDCGVVLRADVLA